jgi:hypothetical protein
MKRAFKVLITFVGWNAAILGFLMLMASSWITATAEAASFYASPSGSGTTCSSASPCSLSTAIGKAVSGDTVIAKNGTYSGSFYSNANGVVIKAENKWGATLKNNNDERIFEIKHSNLKLKGFRIDGQKLGTVGSSLVIKSSVSNVIVEHNYFLNPVGSAIKGGLTATVNGLIIRHNLVEDTGWAANGEAFYIGTSSSTTDNIFNVEIYGNTVRRYTTGGVDLKPNVVNADVHHNIFEGQLYRTNPYKSNNEGTFMVRNKSHRVHNNLIRGATNAKGGIIGIAATRDNQVFKNVVKEMAGVTKIIYAREEGPGGTASQVNANIFCNVNTYNTSVNYGLIVRDNSYDAPLSSCNAEEQRILTEMQSLPGLSYDGGTSIGQVSPSPPSNLKITVAQ